MPRRVFHVVAGTMAGLAAVGLAAIAGWLPREAPSEPDPELLAAPFPAAELALTTSSGEPFSLASLDGPAVVFFGYTHCPDVCPLTLANLRRALDTLGDRGSDVRVLFVTVDPARDSPEQLTEYLKAFEPGFVGLTGTEEEIASAAALWGVYRSVPPDGGDDYVVDHTARSFVVDGEGWIRASFAPDAEVEQMSRVLGKVLDLD